MTTEYVLILGLYAFIFMGVFTGDHGPVAIFKKSGPHLSAKIEQEIQVGKGAGSATAASQATSAGAHGFNNFETQLSIINWQDPKSIK